MRYIGRNGEEEQTEVESKTTESCHALRLLAFPLYYLSIYLHPLSLSLYLSFLFHSNSLILFLPLSLSLSLALTLHFSFLPLMHFLIDKETGKKDWERNAPPPATPCRGHFLRIRVQKWKSRKPERRK